MARLIVYKEGKQKGREREGILDACTLNIVTPFTLSSGTPSTSNSKKHSLIYINNE